MKEQMVKTIMVEYYMALLPFKPKNRVLCNRVAMLEDAISLMEVCFFRRGYVPHPKGLEEEGREQIERAWSGGPLQGGPSLERGKLANPPEKEEPTGGASPLDLATNETEEPGLQVFYLQQPGAFPVLMPPCGLLMHSD